MADTAELQLERVLYILAAAALPGGAVEAELSEALGVSTGQAARDLACLADRAYYQAPGSPGGADLLIDEGRIQVIPRGGLSRPARLSAGEAAALGLGLRQMALESEGARRERLLELGRRMERHAAREAAAPQVASDADLAGAGAPREAVRRAAALGRICRIDYLKADGSRSLREVHPRALVHAERWWYLLARVTEGDERLFRLDRILSAEVLDAPALAVDGPVLERAESGRAFVPPPGTPAARVRYGPRAAPWIRERWTPSEELPGGSVEVTHQVADPEWLLGHVLQYGADAEVLDPEPLRAAVRRRLEETLAAWSDAAAEAT